MFRIERLQFATDVNGNRHLSIADLYRGGLGGLQLKGAFGRQEPDGVGSARLGSPVHMQDIVDQIGGRRRRLRRWCGIGPLAGKGTNHEDGQGEWC